MNISICNSEKQNVRDASDTMYIEILQDQLHSINHPFSIMLAGDLIKMEKIEIITPGKIYYLIEKETQRHLFFCVVIEDLNACQIIMGDDIVYIKKKDIFTILDVYQLVSLSRDL